MEEENQRRIIENLDDLKDNEMVPMATKLDLPIEWNVDDLEPAEGPALEPAEEEPPQQPPADAVQPPQQPPAAVQPPQQPEPESRPISPNTRIKSGIFYSKIVHGDHHTRRSPDLPDDLC